MFELSRKSFNYIILEDKNAITNSCNHGLCLFIIGFGNTIDSHHIIAAVLYVKTQDGTYINWLAVTDRIFTKLIYGFHATEKPFRGMGLATFLLHMVQLQAASQSHSMN